MWKLKEEDKLQGRVGVESFFGPVCEQFACVKRSLQKDVESIIRCLGARNEGTTRRDGNALVLEVRERSPVRSGKNGNSIGGDAVRVVGVRAGHLEHSYLLATTLEDRGLITH